MQFVADGPDVPEVLIQAQEEGRVVFFCGAGISYPAGLPGFKGLVEKIYKKAGTSRTPIEQAAFDRDQFDATLDLLERRITGQRKTVRTALAKALKPKLQLPGATDTHTALLKLARTRNGPLRLVTTNFDRVFDSAAKRSGQKFNAYAAPMLPIPKNSRWDGLVFLHGLLPRVAEENALNRLVMTSGDFGLAYLTERWAARFVSELFRNYVVCFVGYSINDPVLRYMMDALAADRMQGETIQPAWAFGDCERGQEEQKTTEWEAKGVTPILYEVVPGSYDHSGLHLTLQAWSDIYRDGITGKERVVSLSALARPSASTKEDDFVGRMLWALSDKSGLPARQFADFNPVPPLEWLTDAFSQWRFRHSDLSRFGVPAEQEVNPELKFNMVDRPTPYPLAPRMRLATGGMPSGEWDDVMNQLCRWLIRHLDDAHLILWLVGQGGVLHARLEWMIDSRLNELAAWERDGNVIKLQEISSHSPNAIPSAPMRTLWRVLLSRRVKSPWREPDLFRWSERFKQEGMTTLLRLELRGLLAPRIVIKKPVYWGTKPASTESPRRIKDLVDWELALTADYVRSTLGDLSHQRWAVALPLLVEEFERLLVDAMDLLREMGEADDLRDRSHWDLPSVSHHAQNRGFREWVTLIELLRDSWLAERRENPARAARIAQGWFDRPYPTFKRLALFAASQNDCIDSLQWVSWLLANGAWSLWAVDTKRETLSLLRIQSDRLHGPTAQQLQEAILAGPPREMFHERLEPGEWQQTVDRAIWLRLSKLKSSGFALNEEAENRWALLSQAYPNWRLTGNEREEFSHWMSSSSDPDLPVEEEVMVAPTRRDELASWLKLPPNGCYDSGRDRWSAACARHPLKSLYALCDLAAEGIWPIDRWSEALRIWSERRLTALIWGHAAPIVQMLPDHIVLALAHSLTGWLEAVSKKSVGAYDALIRLCHRLIALSSDPQPEDGDVAESGTQPVTEAINHPVGQAVQVLMTLFFNRNPHDNQGLSTPFEPIFTELCNTTIASFRHGRVILASNLIALFRVDRQWTGRHLLPLLNWDLDAAEAKAAWEGFLWSPRIHLPLLKAFKAELLQTPHHYQALADHRQQFAAFFTYVALGPIDGYSVQELRTALHALPEEGLEEAAQALSQALEGAVDQREEYWRNRIKPFLQNIWPKTRNRATPSIADSFARMSLATGSEFPRAFEVIEDWLRPLQHAYSLVEELDESQLAERFPETALSLLSKVINDQPWPSPKLGQCLGSIAHAQPGLLNDFRYQRLVEYSRRRRS